MYTATAKRVYLPRRGHFVHFHDRQRMKKGHPQARLHAPVDQKAAGPAMPLPIDWTKSDTLTFQMWWNDQYGDCMYEAALHADETFTGNAGTEFTAFNAQTLLNSYLRLSHGDNGLDEATLLRGWKAGLAGVRPATYLAAADLDPTNAELAQLVVQHFLGFVFMLDVPDAWVHDFDAGVVWDAPATADSNNGHGTWVNGVGANGSYKVQTWGEHCWVTPAGIQECDASAFAVFSLRMFNASGVAPDGQNYAQKAALWHAMGGPAVPATFTEAQRLLAA